MIKLRRAVAGFTLLEVMIALAILGMSLTVISGSQQNSIRAANRAKWMSVAVMLARYKMVDVEDTLFEEGFSDFEENEEGDFDEEGFEKYSYTLVIDKIELPPTMDANALQGAMGGDDADDTKDNSAAPTPGGAMGGMGGMMSLGAGLLAKQFEMIRNVLEQSIRRVQLKVEWPEGSQIRNVTVVGYFTDPRIIDAAASGKLLPEDPKKEKR
jgi:prepilin-type N-terminal cleavage/methylation domain-containing protein